MRENGQIDYCILSVLSGVDVFSGKESIFSPNLYAPFLNWLIFSYLTDRCGLLYPIDPLICIY